MAIFPGEPGLASFIASKDDGSGGDNWSINTCKAAVKSSSHITTTTNKPTNLDSSFDFDKKIGV